MTYTQAQREFRSLIQRKREYYQYLTTNPSKRDLALKIDTEIRIMLQFYNSALELMDESLLTCSNYEKAVQFYEETKVKLEAICLIHGIKDLPFQMGDSKQSLMSKAITCLKGEEYRIPIGLWDSEGWKKSHV